IKTFAPVEYSGDRIVPVEENGYITITTDNDLRIMHITDVQLGGGFWTYKNDKKTIYEVITMLQKEKPDIVICGGDNTYCLIPPGYNGHGWRRISRCAE
ncbi:MAG: metallophosphoesterase, partial [Treponema sp.]|nr:metallophosphoesterase [Treponema sp.]